MDYPIIPDPRRRRMLAMGPMVAEPAVPEPPTIIDPRQQFAQNVEDTVPTAAITARPRMLPDEPPVDLSAQEDGAYSLPEAAPDRSGIERRWPTIRAAQGEADQRALLEPGLQSQRARRMAETGPPVAKKGWGGRAISALKGLGYAGIGGAVRGAFQPQVVADYEFYNRDLPAAQHQAEIEQTNQNRQLQAGDRMADLTGVNPWTDQPTEPARHRMLQERETAQRNQQINEDRDLTRQDRRQTARELAAKNHVQAARLYRKPVDAQAVKGTSLEWLAGAVPPKDVKLEPGAMTENQRESLNLRKQEFEYRKSHDAEKDAGSGFTPVQLKQLSSQFERRKTEAHRFYNEDVAPQERVLKHFESLLAKGEIIPGTKTNQDPAGIKVTPEMVADQQEKVARLRKTAETKLNEARSLGEQHPRWTDNEAGGDIDYKGMKKGTAPARKGGGQAKPAPHNVALQLYQTYVKQHPENREAARQKFIQQRGVDPEAQ